MKYDRMDAADASLVVLSEIHRDAKYKAPAEQALSSLRFERGVHLRFIIPPE